jgi:hypothetical protein
LLGFEVAVDEARAMDRREAAAGLDEDAGDLGDGSPLLAQPVAQGGAGD